MTLKLYKHDASPPSRAVMMVCDIHNIPVELVDVDLINKEHHAKEYIQKNPIHTVPMLESEDLVLHDSHAIITYLTDKYAADDRWYPKDLEGRARVDQKLYFDTLLFYRLKTIIYPAVFEGDKRPSEKIIKHLYDNYTFMEQFLDGSRYFAGDSMTIADVSIVTSVATMDLIIPLDANRYPKTFAWFKNMEKQSFYQKHNVHGSQMLKSILDAALDI